MMRDELSAVAAPIVARIAAHPFWQGLRDGTLPPPSLWYFAEQDAHYVVPAYARALARTGAFAADDSHAALLCGAAHATFGSLPRLASELSKLADALGAAAAPSTIPGPAIHAHTSFMLAAATTSFPAGAGGLLPMTWFHLEISTDLKRRHRPGSRYASWIAQYCSGDGYEAYVEEYLNMIEEVGANCSASERSELAEQFLLGARYEWAFADTAWRRQAWAV